MDNQSLAALSDPELRQLLSDCVGEIYRRRDKVTYDTDSSCGWAKLVTAVNVHKLNGYSIAGKFISTWKPELVPKGALVLEVDSRKTLYAATGDGEKEKIIAAKDWWEIQKAILARLGQDIEADESLRDE